MRPISQTTSIDSEVIIAAARKDDIEIPTPPSTYQTDQIGSTGEPAGTSTEVNPTHSGEPQPSTPKKEVSVKVVSGFLGI